MYKNEQLNQRINEFKKKVDSKEAKVDAKIRSLEEQASAIQAQIKSQSAKIVELELNGESPNQIDEAKKSNRELRFQLEELKDSIVGYQNQLLRDPSLYAKDFEGIRQAAIKADADRKIEREKLVSTINDKEAQIQTLEKELAQIRTDAYLLGEYDDYHNFISIFSYIDPRTSKLIGPEQERFLKAWLSGSNTEGFFTKNDKPVQPRNVATINNRGESGQRFISNSNNIPVIDPRDLV